MIISGYKPYNHENFSSRKKLENRQLSFTSADPKKFIVKHPNLIKTAIIPFVSFVGSVVGASGYLVGSTGLFYDHFKERQNPNYKEKHEEGVKTITTSTKFGEIGLNAGKVAITATTLAGMSCGIAEGLPLMTLGEATNFNAARIIETPIGTGLFGIGIAAIFAGLALDNTPELKLNELDLRAENGVKNKTKLILKNMGESCKEIIGSVGEVGKNIFNWGFIKENILHGTPRTIVFSEAINKDGIVQLSKGLRHNRSYVMNLATFTLTLGGSGVILSSLLKSKKPQKASLVAEEGGFLLDNLGATRMGLDKYTTNSKSSGAAFAIGGIINAISQFMGLDNKDGRALQWLGIAGVFLGFSIDRFRFFKNSIKLVKARPELTRTVREWKFDLSNLVPNSTERKILLTEIKKGGEITNKEFNDFYTKIEKAVGQDKIRSTEDVLSQFKANLDQKLFKNFEKKETAEIEKTKQVLETCTEKIFGDKNPEIYIEPVKANKKVA